MFLAQLERQASPGTAIRTRHAGDGSSDPEGSRFREARLIVPERREIGQLFEERRGERPAKSLDQLFLLSRRRKLAEGLEGQPARTVRVCSGMREKIPRNPLQPQRPDRIEASVLQAIKELGLER